MKDHRLELADIFRTHQEDFLARWNPVLSRQQRRALRDIRDCRTAVLGGHLQQCDRCGHRVILYNSCRNRHCPKCQATARARWLAQRQAELLPVPYFHVVFTLPQQIGRLALQNAKPILQHLVPRRFPNVAGNRGRPETAGRIHRLSRGPSYLGTESTSAPAPALCRAWRRHLARRFPLDRLPQVLLLSSRARTQPPLPHEVLAATGTSFP